MSVLSGIFIVLLAGALLAIWHNGRIQRREAFIREYMLPKGLYDKLLKRRPELTQKDCALISRGLRQFFLAFAKSGGKYVSMPSQVADDLWHEFILYTRSYEVFCRRAFGQFLHHTPAVVLASNQRTNDGLKRTWWHACKEENIDPKNPSRLPLLFALDAKFGIKDGFRYTPDCKEARLRGNGSSYCAGDIPSSGCGGGLGCTGGGSGCGGGGCGGGD
ncbi:MAG: glycine-rich domain-containing protein [Burkholderiales bacterium]